ncbi:MAG: TSUP family transporter, partial [Solirubrobacteraceae bacterium]
DDLQRINALKGVLSLLIAVVTVAGFALFGPIAWDAALVVGAACLVGGAAGVHLARQMPAHGLRAVVIAYGVIAAVVLLV